MATELAGFSGASKDFSGATNVPIFQTATFDTAHQNEYDYTRSGNPTRHALEELVRRVEHAERAFAFCSGMAALSAVVRLVGPTESIIASADIYGGMHRLLRHYSSTNGVNTEFFPVWDLTALKKRLEDKAGKVKLICLESPTNPLMHVTDIRALCHIAHQHDAIVCVDNSMMSPILMSPLDLQADIVMHSATKFLSGHSDVIAGVLAVRDPGIAQRIAFVQNAEGTGLSPFDSFLVLRGMKTMALRVKAQQANAMEICEYLRHHRLVTRVRYLLPSDAKDDPEAFVHFTQARGGGSVLSFETGDLALSRRIIANLKLFKKTVSFGSVGSLVELPAEMSHASIPAEMRKLAPDLIRMSIGIEDQSDLVRDLSEALAAAQQSHSAATLGVKVPELTRTGYPLGESLPPRDTHAVGVSMPRWADVVAYEEGCARTHAMLQSGYPRFVFVPLVRDLFAKAEELFAGPGEKGMVVPSARVALRLQQFLTKAGVRDSSVHDLCAHGVFAVTFPSESAGLAKLFWQHCGEIVSSRLAQAVLEIVTRTCYENAQVANQIDASPKEPEGRAKHEIDEDNRVASAQATRNLAQWARNDTAELNTQINLSTTEDVAIDEAALPDKSRLTAKSPAIALKRRISALSDEDPRNVFLYPTGMAAIAASHRLLKLSSQWQDAPLRTVVFGFPYLDTLKLNARPELGSGVVFFGRADEADFQGLQQLLSQERIGGLFCEFPSNPLLISPNLARLRELADKYQFPIVVDDTIAGFCNVDLLRQGGADIVCTSLTKQFSGSGNVMGGSLVLNSHSAHHSRLHSRLSRDYEGLLWRDDAEVLLKKSWDLDARVATSNSNAMRLVKYLQAQPQVRTVHYPSLSSPDLYRQWMRQSPSSGYGALLSVVLQNPSDALMFYDNLHVAKGPGFGTNFTLCCPYTQLAHYTELERVSQYGVDSHLVRVWVGLEEFSELESRFADALRSIPASDS